MLRLGQNKRGNLIDYPSDAHNYNHDLFYDFFIKATTLYGLTT